MNGQAYSTPEAAKQKEMELAEQKQDMVNDATFSILFPCIHKKDTDTKFHCVRCGKVLVELDPARENDKPKVLYRDQGGVTNIFSGRYCDSCASQTTRKIRAILAANAEKF